MIRLNDFSKYYVIGVIFWVVVDYTTAFNPDLNDWIAHMPLVWLFYLGSPLLFAYLIYSRKWDDKKVFLFLVPFTLVYEILIFQNALLYTFPILLIMIPAAIGLYSFIAYVPRWIVDRTLRRHAIATAVMFIVWAAIAVLSFKTRLA